MSVSARRRTVATLLVTAMGALAWPALAGEAPKAGPKPEAYSKKAKHIQTLAVFDNPEGAIFSEDGRFVFVSNAAITEPEKGFHWTEKAGYVSKLAVQPDGTLKMVERQLVSGLTAPLGMAVFPVGTRTFPKGSILLCAGGLPMADAQGNEVKDPKRLHSKLVVFNPDGKVLGEIRWDEGSVLAQTTGAPATLPNAAGFDQEGNLYVADTGIGGPTVEPKLETKPGVVMIPKDAIDDLAANRMPQQKPMFIPMPGAPDGVEVGPDGAIHVNTVGVAGGMPDEDKGGMWRLSKEDFRSARLPKAFAGGYGALDGLDFTKAGTRLDTQILPPNYITVVPKGSDKVYSLDISGLNRDLMGPADIAIHERPDGSSLLVIPELSASKGNTRDDTVLVVTLPAGF
jgi:hypothetical protein